MLELLQARKMAEHWCDAWNRRDLDSIMQHYSDDVALNSPFVAERLGNADGWVRGKDNLRAYFALGLKKPDLHLILSTCCSACRRSPSCTGARAGPWSQT